MALIIKPDETTAAKKRIHFGIFDIDGKITDHEAFLLGLAWAVDTFAPAAGDLKVGYDNVASANYGGTFAYRKNGEWYYEFSNAEVAASLGADTVYIEFYRTGYRTFVIRIPLRNDVESIKASTITATAIADNAIAAAKIADNAITADKIATDAIDSDAIAFTAVTELQFGLATQFSLDIVAGYLVEHLPTIEGLQMRLSFTDQAVYSAKKVLTSARVRQFADEATLATALAADADDARGEVARWRWTAVDPGTGLASSWKLVQEL